MRSSPQLFLATLLFLASMPVCVGEESSQKLESLLISFPKREGGGYCIVIGGEDLTPPLQEGEWVFEGSPLEERLKREAALDGKEISDREVLLRVDRECPYRIVALVMRWLTSPGIRLYKVRLGSGKATTGTAPPATRSPSESAEDGGKPGDESTPELPKPRTGEEKSSGDRVVLRIFRDQEAKVASFEFDGQRATNREDLATLIREKVREDPILAVEIQPDPDVPYRYVVMALDECRRCGVDRIEFAGVPR